MNENVTHLISAFKISFCFYNLLAYQVTSSRLFCGVRDNVSPMLHICVLDLLHFSYTLFRKVFFLKQYVFRHFLYSNLAGRTSEFLLILMNVFHFQSLCPQSVCYQCVLHYLGNERQLSITLIHSVVWFLKEVTLNFAHFSRFHKIYCFNRTFLFEMKPNKMFIGK